ncbi:MAG: hypothetical protein J6Y26_05390 [Lachnospiraceae bacterium]|nr:hypothetical protein [Lachnospiraceae bacterium]
MTKRAAEFARDIATQMTVNGRPENKAFWADPKTGKAEWAVNKVLTDLVTGELKVNGYIPPVAGH